MQRSEMVLSMAEQFMSDWTSPVFRDRCVAQIESVRSEVNPQASSDDPLEKFLAQNTSKQLEEFIFSKTKTREDYVSLIAEMLMMLRQHGGKPMVDLAVLETASLDALEASGISPSGASDVKQDEGAGGAE